MAGLWYRAGTVALTNGSKRVTGTGTSWLNQAIGPVKGNIFIGPDNRQYEIDEVLSNTTLDLVEAYAGTTASGQAYKIVTPIKGTTVALATQVAATLQYAQGQYSNLSNWAASDLPADVQVILPDGVSTKDIPNLAKMNASINAKLTSTPQLAALNVPSTAFGRARLNDANAAATIAALGAYSRSNAVGTVSQSNGDPTGAIIERGSNANGEFTKYADGTFECWGTVTLTFSNSAMMSATWTLPVAHATGTGFAASQAPVIDEGASRRKFNQGSVTAGVSVGATAVIRMWAQAGASFVSGETVVVPVYMKGRWF